MFKSARFRKGTAIVRFTHADGLKSTNGQALSHWEVASEDEKFVTALAEIKGNTVVARSDIVKKPKFIRQRLLARLYQIEDTARIRAN